MEIKENKTLLLCNLTTTLLQYLAIPSMCKKEFNFGEH